MKTVLTGKVYWSYDYEVRQKSPLDSIGVHFSAIPPFHKHEGLITLTNDRIILSGDEELKIPLANLESLYLGFDDTFTPSLVKNFGLFWQPLRLSLQTGEVIYVIIDHSMFGSKNQYWFDFLKTILTE